MRETVKLRGEAQGGRAALDLSLLSLTLYLKRSETAIKWDSQRKIKGMMCFIKKKEELLVLLTGSWCVHDLISNELRFLFNST